MAEQPIQASIAMPPRPYTRIRRVGQVASAGFVGAWSTTLTLPVVALSLYLFVIHSNRLPLGWVAVLAGLLGVLLQEKTWMPVPLYWFAAYLAWSAVSGFWSDFGTTVRGEVFEYLKVGVIFLVALNAPKTRGQWNFLLLTWLASYALFPIRGILFNFAAGISVAGRYAWNFIWENPNDFALLTLPMLTLAVAILHGSPPKWVRLGALAGAIILPLAIVLTQSRGGILALATTATLLFLQHRKQAQTIVLIILAVGTLALAAPAGVWTRMTKLAGASTSNLGEIDSSAEQRWELWKVARDVFRDNPIAGVGYGAYPMANAQYFRRDRERGEGFEWIAAGRRDAHSSYLTLLAETGVVGFLIFAGFVGSLFRTGLAQARRLDPFDPSAARQIRVILIGVVGFLQAAIFGSVFHTPFLYLHAALILTLARLATRPISTAPSLSRGYPMPVRNRSAARRR